MIPLRSLLPITLAALVSVTTSLSAADYFVSPTGSDTSGTGSLQSPWKTIAHAAKNVAPSADHTIRITAGTYVETEATVLPLGVNLVGAGEDQVTITSNGAIPSPPGVDDTNPDFKKWYYGSLIQLYSAGYGEGEDILLGEFEDMIPSADGNQTLSGFTIDGGDQIKAGVWVQNRNNVTMHDVTISNCIQRGAVFTRSDLEWFLPLPDGLWMYNTTIYDCEFYSNGIPIFSFASGTLVIEEISGNRA